MQKTSEITDQVQGILEENIHNFTEGMHLPNERFIEENDLERKVLYDQYHLLQYHYPLNNLSFKGLKAQEKLGIIP